MSNEEYDQKIVPYFAKLGNFKDEAEGKHILEFIALRAKMYSFSMEGKEAHKIKGVGKSAQKAIKHANFKECLQTSMKAPTENEETILNQKCSFLSIQSTNHKLETKRIEKNSICCYDNKTYYLDAYTSLPFGHYKIPK